MKKTRYSGSLAPLLLFVLLPRLGLEGGEIRGAVTRTGIEADSLEAKIDLIFRDWDQPQTPGGAIAIVKDGALVFMKGYGLADLEDAVRTTPSTSFYLASISKQFTGYCIAKLIKDGRLALDDDVRKHIPEMPDFKRSLRVRDLIFHKSGLRDLYGLWPLTGSPLNGYISGDDVLKILYRQKGLNFWPGEEWEYSNTNYFLLAELIKRITGETIKTWADKNVFSPLNMDNTSFVDSIGTLVPFRAESYRQNKDGSLSNDPFLDVTVGHTGLYSTAEDMSKWLAHIRQMSRTNDPVLAIMLQTDTLNNGRAIENYSFGLFKTRNKALNYWHRGSLFGFKSIISYYPEQDFGFVIMGNVQTFNRIKYAREITRLFYPEIAPDEPIQQYKGVLDDSGKKKGIFVEPGTLKKYLGTYVVDPATVYTIGLQDESLFLTEVSVSGMAKLIPIEINTFRNEEGSRLIGFSMNDRGAVDKMTYQDASTRAEGVKGKVLSPAQEDDIAGDYHNDELEISIRIAKTPRGLEAFSGTLGRIALFPTYEDQFRCDHDFFSSFTLSRDADKKIDGFLLSGFTVRRMRFIRR